MIACCQQKEYLQMTEVFLPDPKENIQVWDIPLTATQTSWIAGQGASECHS